MTPARHSRQDFPAVPGGTETRDVVKLRAAARSARCPGAGALRPSPARRDRRVPGPAMRAPLRL